MQTHPHSTICSYTVITTGTCDHATTLWWKKLAEVSLEVCAGLRELLDNLHGGFESSQRWQKVLYLAFAAWKENNICKGQNLVHRDYSEHIHVHAHTHRHLHTCALKLYKAQPTQFKMGSNQRPETDEDSSTEQKTWQVYSFGKNNNFRLYLNESRDSFCQRGRGRSFHNSYRFKCYVQFCLAPS